MPIAVTPQQAADLPDIVARPTMWAATNLASLLYGKLNDIVGVRRHDHEKVIEQSGFDCERILTSVRSARICVQNVTCVG